MAVQHVAMALRNNTRFEVSCDWLTSDPILTSDWSVDPLLICDWLKVSKPLPNIGCQLRSTFFLIKDAQEPKIQKLLMWTDFGPFKCLEDKNLQSIVKSLSAIEARILNAKFKDKPYTKFQHPFIEKPDMMTVTESGILTISKYHKVTSFHSNSTLPQHITVTIR